MKFRVDSIHMDASENAFFTRQLEYIRQGAFEVQFPELKARMMIPVNNSVSPGAEIFTYRFFEHFGGAKEITDYADDLPRADVKGEEASSRIRAIGSSYGYSVQEIRAAQLAGMDLSGNKAMACRRSIEQKLDEVAMIGGLNGLNGILSLTNTLTFTPTATIASLIAADDRDGAVQMLHAMVHTVVNTTLEVEQPDSMILPLSLYNLLSSTRMGDSSDGSMLSHFLNTNSYVNQIYKTHRSEAAGAGGTSRVVVYKRSPDKLEWIMPLEFTQHAPEVRGLETVTLCEARTGGIVVYFPKSICYADGL